MRLRPDQAATIRRLVHARLGEAARIVLFGSQTDDAARGGDIDLLVELPDRPADLLGRELRLQIELEAALDDRKVDLLVHVGAEPPPIVRIARRTGVLL